MRKILLIIKAMLLTLLSLACLSAFANTATAQVSNADSLYVRMGGTPVVTKMIDEFVDIVSKDARTKRSFDGIKLNLKRKYCVAYLPYHRRWLCV